MERLDDHALRALFMFMGLDRTIAAKILSAPQTHSDNGAELWSKFFTEAYKRKPDKNALDAFENVAKLYDEDHKDVAAALRTNREAFAADFDIPLD